MGSSATDKESEQRPESTFKKRRLRGSCDSCAQRKIKCDRAVIGIGKPCSNCLTLKAKCVYSKGGRESDFSIARDLVSLPSGSRKSVCPKDPNEQERTLKALVEYARHLEQDNASLRKNISANKSEGRSSSEPTEEGKHTLQPEIENEDQADEDEFDSDRGLYYGQYSHVALAKTALEELNQKSSTKTSLSGHPKRRQRFWLYPSWDGPAHESIPVYVLPPDDLMFSLINLYFIYINPYMPFIHHPTFMKSVAERLWERNHYFGGLVLAVCALASRHSDDPRTRIDNDPHTAGWMWFRQIQLFRQYYYRPISLFELQVFCIATCYLHDTQSDGKIWPFLALGIRQAQELGIHCSRGPTDPVTEMWRRAYWSLITMDAVVAGAYGRPRATAIHDHNLEMIADVDDEFWINHDDPKLNFKQPEDKLSTMSYYIALLKLFDILGYSQRTLSVVRKPVKGNREAWTKRILSELRDALDRWKEDLPSHLKWDPHQKDLVLFNQSAYIVTSLTFVTIQIFRPYIPSYSKDGSNAFSAYTICLESARMCCHVIRAQEHRNEFLACPQTQMALLSAGIILILQIRKNTGDVVATDRDSDVRDIQTILNLLKRLEPRWRTCGRFLDKLTELYESSEAPVGQSDTYQRSSQKRRERDLEEESSKSYSSSSNSNNSADAFMPSGLPATLVSPYHGLYPVHEHQEWPSQPKVFNHPTYAYTGLGSVGPSKSESFEYAMSGNQGQWNPYQRVWSDQGYGHEVSSSRSTLNQWAQPGPPASECIPDQLMSRNAHNMTQVAGNCGHSLQNTGCGQTKNLLS